MSQLIPKTPKTPVGVIIGRFQVPYLHKGHFDLLDTVYDRHDTMIIFLGSCPGVVSTDRNPMDFMTRKKMIQSRLPSAIILPLPDQPTDKGWADDLDRRISEIVGTQSATLYGSRDGFMPAYKGTRPTVELEATKHVSGTEIREGINTDVGKSREFREGLIYASHNRHPTSYQTVDMCVWRNHHNNTKQILIARKPTDPEGKWRLPGGFVDPTDESLERAAIRELREETSGFETSDPEYLGSFRIDDWRYRKEQDKIMTALFLFEFQFGSPTPSDDISELKWSGLSMSTLSIIPAHRPLIQNVQSYLAN